MRLSPYAKAIVAAAIAAGSFAIPVVDDGLMPSEIIGILVAFLVGLGVVYAVPNKPRIIPPEDLAEERMQPEKKPSPYQPRQQPPIPKPHFGTRNASSNPYDASGRSSN